jgi:hypothetical protein
LLLSPLLRGGGPGREHEREAQNRRSGYGRQELWLGVTNVHYRSPFWFLFRHLLSIQRPAQATNRQAKVADAGWCFWNETVRSALGCQRDSAQIGAVGVAKISRLENLALKILPKERTGG